MFKRGLIRKGGLYLLNLAVKKGGGERGLKREGGLITILL